MKQLFSNFKSNKFLGLFTFIAFLPNLAFAAGGGIDKVNTLFNNISTALYGLGVVILTLAVMWAGYKIMWMGQTIQQVAPTLIGGVLVGSASAVAGFLFS